MELWIPTPNSLKKEKKKSIKQKHLYSLSFSLPAYILQGHLAKNKVGIYLNWTCN